MKQKPPAAVFGMLQATPLPCNSMNKHTAREEFFQLIREETLFLEADSLFF